MPRRTPPANPGTAQPPNIPAPLRVAPGEPISHMWMRAFMLAEHHGLIGEYIGPIDADTTPPSELTFAFMERGRRVSSLRPALRTASTRKGKEAPAEEPLTMPGVEACPIFYGMAVTQGIGEIFAYREGLPGWEN